MKEYFNRIYFFTILFFSVVFSNPPFDLDGDGQFDGDRFNLQYDIDGLVL